MKKAPIPAWKPSLLSCAVALAVSGMSQSAQAVDLCAGNGDTSVTTSVTGVSCTLDASATLTVGTGGTIDAGVEGTTADNNIHNAGSITNAGSSSHAVYYSSGLDGTITNSGTIESVSGSTNSSALAIHVEGDVNGSIVNSGSLTGFLNNPDGSDSYGNAIYIQGGSLNGNLTNTGTITGKAATGTGSGSHLGASGLYVDYDLTGTVTNSGTIATTLDLTGSTHGGLFPIYIGGNVDSGVISNTGTLLASAQIDSALSASMISIDGDLTSASISNSGTITASTVSNNGAVETYGITTGGLADSTIDNLAGGTISLTGVASSDASVYGIYTGDLSGASRIGNAGTLSVSGDGSSGASVIALKTGGVYDTSVIRNTGNVVSSAQGGSSGADAYGIYSYNLTDSATLANQGSIVVTADASSSSARGFGIFVDQPLSSTSSVQNSGTLTVTGSVLGGYARAYGAKLADIGAGNSLANTGTINATADGGASGTASAFGIFTGGVNGTLSNSGTIYSSGSGYVTYNYGIRSNSIGGAETNTGKIITLANSDSSGSAVAYGIYGSTGVSSGGSLSNSGAITATGLATGTISGYAGAYGINLNGSSGALSNDVGAVISAAASGVTGASAKGIYVGSGGISGTGSVTNAGAIVASAQANGGGSTVWAYGIEIDGSLSGSAALSNSGSIAVSATNSMGGFSPAAVAIGVSAGTLGTGTTLSNTGSVTAFASSSQDISVAIGVDIGTLNSGATFINDGFIMASHGTGNTGPVYSVSVSGGTGGVFTNNGTLMGGVSLGGTTSMTNAGSMKVWSDSGASVGGDYTQASSGSLNLEVKDATEYAQLNVAGTADFSAGNAVKVSLNPGSTLTDGAALNDVISAGTLTASSFSVTSGSAFWNFSSTIDANTLDLVAHRVSTASVLAGTGYKLSGSQSAFIDSVLGAGSSGPFADLAAAFNSASTGTQVAGLLEQVGPGMAGAAAQASSTIGSDIGKTISKHQARKRGASSGDGFTDKSWWIKPYFSQGSQDASDGVKGYDVDSTGFVLGVDGAVSDDWRVGIALASAQSQLDGNSDSTDVSTLQFTVYGSRELGESAVMNFAAGYGKHSYDGSRHISLIGQTAKADYDGTQYYLSADYGKSYALGENWTFMPSAGAALISTSIDSYDETGAGAYNLSVDSSSEDKLVLSTKADFERSLSKNSALSANVALGFDAQNDQATATSVLQGSGVEVVSNGIKQDPLIYGAGLGYRYTTASNVEFSASYDLEMRDGFSNNLISVKAKMPF